MYVSKNKICSSQTLADSYICKKSHTAHDYSNYVVTHVRKHVNFVIQYYLAT